MPTLDLPDEKYKTIESYAIKVRGAFLPARINAAGPNYRAFIAAHGHPTNWYATPAPPPQYEM